MTDAIRRSRSVAAATAASATNGSGATVPIDTPVESQMLSPSQPDASAARPRRTIASGSARSPSGATSTAKRIVSGDAPAVDPCASGCSA
jgi:hypothetical protein